MGGDREPMRMWCVRFAGQFQKSPQNFAYVHNCPKMFLNLAFIVFKYVMCIRVYTSILVNLIYVMLA